MEKFCPLLLKPCDKDCKWYIDGECAIVIIAKNFKKNTETSFSIPKPPIMDDPDDPNKLPPFHI